MRAGPVIRGNLRELLGNGRKGTCDCVGNAAEVFAEGTSGEGGTRLAGRGLEADASITPRTSHVPIGQQLT
jgi:hypothetical protein